MEAIETLAGLWIAEHPEYQPELADVDTAVQAAPGELALPGVGPTPIAGASKVTDPTTPVAAPAAPTPAASAPAASPAPPAPAPAGPPAAGPDWR